MQILVLRWWKHFWISVTEISFTVNSFNTHGPIFVYENCPYLEFFWSVISRIWTEYWEILRISPYSLQMSENTGQKNPKYGNFSRSVYFNIFQFSAAFVTIEIDGDIDIEWVKVSKTSDPYRHVRLTIGISRNR